MGKSVKVQFLKNIGSGWLALGVVGLVQFFMMPLNMRMLTREVYGISELAVSAMTIFSFLSFGMGPAFLRFFSKAIETKDRERIRQLSSTAQALLGGLGLVGAGLLISTFPSFMTLYGIDPLQRSNVLILFLALAFSYWEHFFLLPFFSMIQGSNRFDLGNIVRIFSVLLRMVVLCLGYYFFEPTLKVMALATFSESLFRLVVIQRLAVKNCGLGREVLFSPRSLKFTILPAIFSFGLVAFTNTLFFNLSIQVPKMIIGKTLGLDQVALFAPALALGGILASILGVVCTPLTPLATRDATHSGGKNIGNWSIDIGQFITCVGCGILLFFALFGEDFVGIWFRGQALEKTNPVILAIVFGIVISSTQSTNYHLALGCGSILPIAISSIVMFLLTVGGTFLGTTSLGWDLFRVAVWIAVVRVVRNVIFLAYLYSRQFHYRFGEYFLKVYLAPILLAVLAAFLLTPVRARISIDGSLVRLIAFSIPVVLLYWGVAWLLVIDKRMKSAVRSLLQRKRK